MHEYLPILIVGSIMYIALDDKIMLMLSLPLMLLSAGRCVLLYRQIGRGAYEWVEGVCIKIQKAPLRRGAFVLSQIAVLSIR